MGCPPVCMGTHSEWPRGESGEEAGLLWEGKLLSSAFKEGKDVIWQRQQGHRSRRKGWRKGPSSQLGALNPAAMAAPRGPCLPPRLHSPPLLILPHHILGFISWPGGALSWMLVSALSPWSLSAAQRVHPNPLWLARLELPSPCLRFTSSCTHLAWFCWKLHPQGSRGGLGCSRASQKIPEALTGWFSLKT